MLSRDYLMPRSAPFETPPAAAPQDKGSVSKHAQLRRSTSFTASINFAESLVRGVVTPLCDNRSDFGSASNS
jgi:hypothetical protein